jgi:hypothetical protein
VITWHNVLVFVTACGFGATIGFTQNWFKRRGDTYRLLEKQTSNLGHWLQGPVWIEKTDNPFERTELFITDVRDGWVQYCFKTLKGKGVSDRSNYSMRFNFLYEHYKPRGFKVEVEK